MGKPSGSAVRIYQITYIFGLAFRITLHLLVNKLFPPPGLSISEDFDEHLIITNGITTHSDDSATHEKKPEVIDKHISEDITV
jgi:hypothetical protein